MWFVCFSKQFKQIETVLQSLFGGTHILFSKYWILLPKPENNVVVLKWVQDESLAPMTFYCSHLEVWILSNWRNRLTTFLNKKLSKKWSKFKHKQKYKPFTEAFRLVFFCKQNALAMFTYSKQKSENHMEGSYASAHFFL